MIQLVVPCTALSILKFSFSGNLPFGPFFPNEVVKASFSLTNISLNQMITICEGSCIRDEFTYSPGDVASTLSGCLSFFGNALFDSASDGGIAGALLPGEEKNYCLSSKGIHHEIYWA